MIKNMSTIGKRLSEEIERLGGVSEVANKIGTVRNTIYNWIQKENIPINKLVDLGKLGADQVYILTGIHNENNLQPRESALIDNYRNSNEKDKKVIESVAFATAKPENQEQQLTKGE